MSRHKNKATEYAIVDIETTGGSAASSRITEIAICIHNGKEVTRRYEQLVNPERDIPPSIVRLTGITNEMVEDAPPFAYIADEVYELLKDRVFVAHNVNFDYSFVRHELEEVGIEWTAKKLCTVRMARRIRPGLSSYSLGRLCGSLGIALSNRHRAGGDAEATAVLFSRLLEWDEGDRVPEMLKRNSGDQQLPPNLPREQYESLPERYGVYYFHNQAGKVVYAGKARNVKKRVGQHFTGHNINPQRQHFMRHIYSISYEICATELMALLLECMEIKRHWPPFNRALKRFEPKYGLVLYEDQVGYKRLAVGRLDKRDKCVQVCNREYESVILLKELMFRFDLDERLCSFGRARENYFSAVHALQDPLPERDAHNALVDEALVYLAGERKSFAILDKGRELGEKSCIWVERGNLYAMGYIAADTQMNTLEEVRDSLKRCYGNHYMMQLIHDYAGDHPHKVMRVS
ncbi:exonuclease domain-containing protein [Olivibacter sp. XZL3]|uniref:exonuclease domain-containing protein n=1 Tax=Olivibacter sp. XZL3 TaxID=1735116 RepID=UPI001064D8F5|nr:exonuclease domain-containing protein [Olivibacter sp. XZL3]